MKLKKTHNILAQLILGLFIFSCDFTPLIHKEILSAQNYILAQEYLKAIVKYEQILEKDPEDDLKLKIYFQLGELYSIHKQDNKKALEYYNLVRTVTNDPLWIVKTEEKIAEINFTFLKNFKESAISYKRLAKIRPRLNKTDLYEYRYGLSLKNIRAYQLSSDIFKSINKNQKHEYFAKSFYELGLIKFEKKDFKGAINLWSQYIRRERDRDAVIQAKFMIANAYETIEELAKAYNIYYSIVGDYPNTEVIQERLKSLYERRISRKR